jgi:hypothetical protein
LKYCRTRFAGTPVFLDASQMQDTCRTSLVDVVDLRAAAYNRRGKHLCPTGLNLQNLYCPNTPNEERI